MAKFEEVKEEIYSSIERKCRRLLLATKREKEQTLCPLCSSQCNDGLKLLRSLRRLIEDLTMVAVTELPKQDDKLALWYACLLAPHDSTINLLEALSDRDEVITFVLSELEKSVSKVRDLKGGKNESKT